MIRPDRWDVDRRVPPASQGQTGLVRGVLGYLRLPVNRSHRLTRQAYRYPNSRSYSLWERTSRIRTMVPTPGADRTAETPRYASDRSKRRALVTVAGRPRP